MTNQNSQTDVEPDSESIVSKFSRDERGIMWTLEVALVVVLFFGAIIFLVQAIPSDDGQRTDISEQKIDRWTEDVLTLSGNDNRLRNGVLYYDATEGEYIDTDSEVIDGGNYISFDSDDNHPFASVFGSVERYDLAYSISFRYVDSGGTTVERALVYQGDPPAAASKSTVTSTFTLQDDDVPYESSQRDEDGEDCTLGDIHNEVDGCEDDTFLIPNTASGPNQYASLTIEIELWVV